MGKRKSKFNSRLGELALERAKCLHMALINMIATKLRDAGLRVDLPLVFVDNARDVCQKLKTVTTIACAPAICALIRPKLTDFPDALDVITQSQPFCYFRDEQASGTRLDSWLDAVSNIANDNKHVQLTQHNSTSVLKSTATGLIELRDSKVEVEVRSAYPELKAWTLWSRLADLGLSDHERRELSRAARQLLANHPDSHPERSTYFKTMPMGDISAMVVSEDAERFVEDGELHKNLQKDVKHFEDHPFKDKSRAHLDFKGDDMLRNQFVEVLVKFVKERLDWQRSSVRIRDVRPDDKLPLMRLGYRAFDHIEAIVNSFAQVESTLSSNPRHLARHWRAIDYNDLGRIKSASDALDILRNSSSSTLDVGDVMVSLHRLAASAKDVSESAKLWKYAGDSAHGSAQKVIGDDGDAQQRRSLLRMVVRACWRRCAEVLDYGASSRSLIEMRLDALRLLYESCMADDLLECASSARAASLVEHDLYLPCVPKIGNDFDELWWRECQTLDVDVFAQLLHCRSIAERTLVHSLWLRAAVQAGRGPDTRAMQLELMQSVQAALLKCRNLLDHGWARFLRHCVKVEGMSNIKQNSAWIRFNFVYF